MKMRMVLVLFIIIGLVGTGIAGEKDLIDDTQYRPYALGEVVVSAKKPVSEKVGTVLRISAVDIENSGARNLSEVIDLLPGVYVRMGGSGTPRVDIRGFRTRHVILLLDGIPFNSTFDAQFDPTTIPVENIAEVKVITGGGSLLYGQGGNGGIINIITKKGNTGIHGSMSAEMGSESARIGRFTLSGASDKFDAFVSGSINKKDGFPLSDDFDETADEDGGTRENSDFERKNLDANFGYSPTDNITIGLSANHIEGDNGVPAVVNYDKKDPFTKKPKYNRVEDLSGDAFQLAFSHAGTSPFSLRGWFYVNDQEIKENRYDDGTYTTQTKKGAYASDSSSKINGANLQASVDLNDMGRASLALITETHKWEADGFEIDKNGNQDLFDEKEDFKIHNVALEYGVSPVDGLDLVLGYGYHQQDMDGGDESDSSWLVGAGYDLFENTELKASYARKIRFPSIRDLYDVGSGNPDLEAERTDHYEFGITQGFCGNSEASVTVFRIDAEDFIEKDNGGISQNWDDYKFVGCEIVVQTRPLDNWVVKASYSYIDATDEADDAERDELQHRPRQKYGLETTYRFDFGLTVHGDVVRVADQYYYDNDDTPPLMKDALDDYTLVNFKISQRLLKNTLEAYIGSDNLFDEDYEQSYGLPQAGRTFYGGMTLKF
jgi:vitamin B12 transporter